LKSEIRLWKRFEEITSKSIRYIDLDLRQIWSKESEQFGIKEGICLKMRAEGNAACADPVRSQSAAISTLNMPMHTQIITVRFIFISIIYDGCRYLYVRDASGT
jgi:hypothetical protein